MSKKLAISIPVLVAVIVSVIVTTVMLNNKEPKKDPNLSPETSQATDNEDNEETTMDKVYVSINNKELEIELDDNSTVSALVKLLPLELSMSDLNGNEKYTYLDESLPTNTYSPKHIEAGDVMLFGDNCLVIFYESFDTSYSYSKIGRVKDLPELGDGDISIKLDTKTVKGLAK